jgi:hypothetical protein
VLGRCSFAASTPADGALRALRDLELPGLDDEEEQAASVT